MHKQNLQNVNYIFKNSSYKYKFLGSNSEDSATSTAVHKNKFKVLFFGGGGEEGNLFDFGFDYLNSQMVSGDCDYDL